MRRPLDRELVRRGLAVDIEEAQRLIRANRVLVNGAPALNAGRQVDPGESISFAKQATRFVGRGGEKLEAALESLAVGVQDHRVLDAGASTGGFTDVLLGRGAREVLAVDVGRGQLHERLRRDPRVTVMDRVNVRLVGSQELGSFDTVVADLSFISLTAVMGNLVDCTRPGGDLVLLVKPQFEADRAEAGHNRGVITDPAQWRSALERTSRSAEIHGVSVAGICVSPIRGADGNVEFFMRLVKPGPGGVPLVGDVPEMIDAAVGTASSLVVGSREQVL